MSPLSSPSHVAQPVTHPGAWRLDAGRAMQLRPRQAGCFKVLAGQVWATTDAPFESHARRLGDHVLSAGDALAVMPGERLVVEAWGDAPARFDWTFHAEAVAPMQSRWQAQVAAPGRELARALGDTAGALARLGWGLTAYTTHLLGYLVAGRGRVMSPFDANPP